MVILMIIHLIRSFFIPNLTKLTIRIYYLVIKTRLHKNLEYFIQRFNQKLQEKLCKSRNWNIGLNWENGIISHQKVSNYHLLVPNFIGREKEGFARVELMENVLVIPMLLQR